MRSHAANPYAEIRTDGDWRVYFSCRDQDNRSHIGFVDVCSRTWSVRAIAEQPVLSPGPRGTFDDSGASLGCIVENSNVRYLYYVGWNLGVTVPWRNSIGVAISRDGGPFLKPTCAPVLDRNPHDPYSLSYPWVVHESTGWRMWYGSHLNWGDGTREMEHVIKYAESTDGVRWQPTGAVCLPVMSDDSYAYARPCVLYEAGTYKMWFSYRGRQYRIGYAESTDGLRWQRMDDRAGLLPSGEGWDADAVAYAHVFVHNGQRYALYCGNDYGRSGFGVAVMNPA
jgi:hypothetical protein